MMQEIHEMMRFLNVKNHKELVLRLTEIHNDKMAFTDSPLKTRVQFLNVLSKAETEINIYRNNSTFFDKTEVFFMIELHPLVFELRTSLTIHLNKLLS